MNYDEFNNVKPTVSPSNIERKQTIDSWDLFPGRDASASNSINALFPDKIVDLHRQLAAQRKLAESAVLFNEAMESLSLKNKTMSDDERRAQKIKDRYYMRKQRLQPLQNEIGK